MERPPPNSAGYQIPLHTPVPPSGPSVPGDLFKMVVSSLWLAILYVKS